MITMIHSFEIDFDAVAEGFRAGCECGWVSDPYAESWQADEEGWYHADYPEGE